MRRPLSRGVVLRGVAILALLAGLIAAGPLLGGPAAQAEPVTPATGINLGVTRWTAWGYGDGTIVTVYADGDWQVDPLPDWLHVDKMSGNGMGSVTVYADPNVRGQIRTWDVKVRGQGQPAVLSVTQTTEPVIANDCGVTMSSACPQTKLSDRDATYIDYSGDRDWFKFIPDSTGVWTFRLTGSARTGAVYDANGPTKIGSGAMGEFSQWGFDVKAPLVAYQMYYIEIAAESVAIGMYGVSPSRPPNAPYLSLSTDLLKPLSTGDTSQIKVVTNSDWRVYVPDWITASPDSGRGDTTVTLTFDPNETGQWRWVMPSFMAGGMQLRFKVEQTSLPADNCTATKKTACDWADLDTPLLATAQYSGDADWFRFTAPRSGLWTFTGSVPETGGTTNTRAALRSADGVGLAYNNNDYLGPTAQLSVKAELVAGTTYYLDVDAYTSGGAATYIVTAKGPPKPVPDCGAGLGSQVCVWTDLSVSVRGNAETELDEDWYRITPTVSGLWTFRSSPTATGGLTGGLGRVFDATGKLIALDNDYWRENNGQFAVSVQLAAGSTYYLSVLSWIGKTGAYVVTATPPGQPPVGHETVDCGATVTTACEWTDLSAPRYGSLDTGDWDSYKFTVPVSGRYVFTSSAPPTGGTPTPRARLTDAAGSFENTGHYRDGDPAQFELAADLKAGTVYLLTVSDQSVRNFGTYIVTATGPV